MRFDIAQHLTSVRGSVRSLLKANQLDFLPPSFSLTEKISAPKMFKAGERQGTKLQSRNILSSNHRCVIRYATQTTQLPVNLPDTLDLFLLVKAIIEMFASV